MTEPIQPKVDPTLPIEPTRNDPTPEERVGDSRFLPVIVAAGVALIVILIAALVLINGKGKKLLPQEKTPHPTSQVIFQPSTRAA